MNNYDQPDMFGTRTRSGGKVLSITVHGYVPCNRNQMNGCHWMLLLKEKKRAGMKLLAALKSCSLSIQGDPATGMDTTLKLCKIFSSKLGSYRTTDGQLFLVGSCPAKLQRKGKKKPSSKSEQSTHFGKVPF